MQIPPSLPANSSNTLAPPTFNQDQGLINKAAAFLKELDGPPDTDKKIGEILGGGGNEDGGIDPEYWTDPFPLNLRHRHDV